MKQLAGWGIAALYFAAGIGSVASAAELDYEQARWDPIHFKPLIDQASNAQCLACHQEILERRPLATSPAGVSSDDVLAWYQTLDTYEGPQDTIHRRHLVTPLATRLMDMRCNTCHQGNDPREEAPIPPVASNADFTLRKSVDVKETCLMCHGQFNYQVMALPGPWHESAEIFGNTCLTCHAGIRTERHRVNFLKPDAIEEAAKESADACYGCHGGRAWYRINFPYPRHPYPGMAEEVPDWAKDRPSESKARYMTGAR